MNDNPGEIEKKRLKALKELDIIGSESEQSFDDIVLLASKIFNVPISAISLVAENIQWFKAKVGLEVKSTPRDVAFCTHTILGDDVLVVNDASSHPLFQKNPLVTGELGIRFYAGAPLVTKEGHALGTICVIDQKAREILPCEIEALKALSRQIMALIELRYKASELIRANNLIKEANAKSQALNDCSPIGVFATDKSGACTYVNRIYLEITGFTEDGLLGDGWQFAIHPEDRNRVFSEWKEFAYNNSVYSSIHRFVTPSGQVRTCSVKAAEIRMDDQILGYVGTTEDITNKLKIEKNLEMERKRLELALDGGKLGLWDWNIITNETIFNKRWAEMLGENIDDIPFNVNSWLERAHPDDIEMCKKAIEDHLSGKTEFYESTHRMRHVDGTWRWILDRGKLVEHTAGEKPLRIVGTHLDITEQVEARKKAEEASYIKAQFLANMSHEIRTPMNGIIGMSHLLSESDLNEDQRSLLNDVIYSAKSLLSIINDILDLSKIESGKLQIHPVTFDIYQLIDLAISAVRFNAEEKNIELACDIDCDVPKYILADDVRIRQILINLLGNAIKFTVSGGGILFKISKSKQEGSGEVLIFTVTDSGIGIPEERLSKIFQPFTQSDGTTTRQFGGTGLGLSIVDQLVEMMGGEIKVFSKQGVGSCFTFNIPLINATNSISASNNELQKLPAVKESLSFKASILIVEDNIINQRLAKRVFEKMGCNVQIASNGKEAFEFYTSNPSSLDLIFMDCQMPVMSGYESSRAIRLHEEGSSQHVPIIAMTANSMKGDRENCLDSGMDDYISKPFEQAEIVRVLSQYLS